MHATSIFCALLSVSGILALPTPTNGASIDVSSRQTDPEWTYYDTEAECLTAGWGYCRSYAVDVGVTKWVGFPGAPAPGPTRYESEAACLADGHTVCLRIRRADGTVYWRAVDFDDEEPETVATTAVTTAVESALTNDSWTYYDTEALCLAAGWDYCRSYAVDVGVTKWIGFTGQQETTPTYLSEEACHAAGYTTCLSYKRADGTHRWIGFNDE